MKRNINYEIIYDYLKNTKLRIVSAASIARGIGVERIYGPTMTKLVNDGYLERCATKGLYYNHNHR